MTIVQAILCWLILNEIALLIVIPSVAENVTVTGH
jgi:hypothetical protein